MPEAFQRLFQRSDIAAVQSLNVQAALGPVRQPERSQFVLLLRHFFERFFNHETASATGDGKARLVQIACATGLPPLMVAVYLWPVYHPFKGWPPGNSGGPPAYWVQANHHFFFVMYSFVVMGLITVFEWDLFFPDLLDVFVLGTLPIPQLRQFAARVAAIAVLVGGFLLDANLLAIFVLPLSVDPPQLLPLVTSHACAVALAGIFSAGFVLALQGTLLALVGEKLFRRFSLLLQGFTVAAFLVLLLLFPVLSGITPGLLQSNAPLARAFPPFWFLAVFQLNLPDAPTLPSWPTLAHTGILATALVWAIVVAAYPLAHFRRVNTLIQGTTSRRGRNWLLVPLHRLLHSTILRSPLRRGVFHFISQTLLRVPRYRIYLVLYCGVGVALVTAAILRLDVDHGHLRAAFSADGIRASIGIIAFWVIAGLRSTFVSPGNQQGGWIFRTIHGKPAPYDVALRQFQAAPLWSWLTASTVTSAAIAAFQLVAPAELRTWPSLTAQLITGLGLCLLLTDAFFLNVTTIPFTGERPAHEQNLAFTVLRYYTFFPFVTTGAVGFQYLMERGGARLGIALTVIAVLHLWLRWRHRGIVRLDSAQRALEEDEDDFLLRLGLRY
ncbi:hypothetical protein [Occallatibacter riparius]|uniref:Uncharacterized protein n=1 Tax=Occallatibacter riparius TaxID=1002689 RepID=A0A9J7BQ00_9BACT|nr:hypothetical protein [Occallatibacter riparius]UWZ84859.1 hypothetical protein MOP44_02715 [Occallatibacter riparius]